MRQLFTAFLLLTTFGASFSQQVVTPDAQPLNMRTDANNVTVFIGLSTTATNGGGSNTFVGYQAGQGTSSGMQNTFVGFRAGSPNTVGSRNTFVGYQIGQLNTDGSDNVFMGYNAGGRSLRGNRNIGIGVGAGLFSDDASDNTLIGSNALGEGTNLHNATAIGANARVSASNALILGNSANVGIGNSAPQSKLELTADADNQSGLRFTKLTAQSPIVSGATDRFLTVSSTGDVTLGSQLSTQSLVVRTVSPGQWADAVFAPGYRLRPLTEVAAFIEQNKHLPDVPSAETMTQQGVNLTDLLATLLRKNEELTLYVIEQQKRIDQLERRLKSQP